MSDPTKKSIVINKSFLSNSGGGSESSSSTTKNKSRKQSRQKIPDEVIKPSKLKQILLDKINAKRKAELTMASATPHVSSASASTSASAKSSKHKGLDFGIGNNGGSGNTNNGIDKEKEAKIFSDEFKKSLSFLDKYIQTKNSQKSEKNQHRQHSKTLKRASGTSLNEDILKSLHNSRNNHNTSPHRTQLNVNTQLSQKSPATYASNIVQRSVSPSRPISPSQKGVSFAIQPMQSTQKISPVSVSGPSPGFQKIQLNIPKVNNAAQSYNAAVPKNEKITLALGKPASPSPSPSVVSVPGTTMTDAGSLIYTELPPELMPNTPMSMPMSMSTSMAPIISEPIVPSPIPSPTLSSANAHTEPLVESFDLSSSTTSLSTSTPTFSPIKLTDDKPYGCLKGGKKPTFRLYNKTIKHSNHTNNDENIYSERQQKLNELRNKHNPKINKGVSSTSSLHGHGYGGLENDEMDEKGEKRENKIGNSTSTKSSNRVTKIRKRLRKTITKRFKLGKQGNVVGVLIKNNDTRKKIQKEHGILKNKNLSDVKKYLIEQKLIKIGSTAPPNIIRKIYEDSVLTGEVENIGRDVILHNFLEQNKSW
jgi:hypothetical protein